MKRMGSRCCRIYEVQCDTAVDKVSSVWLNVTTLGMELSIEARWKRHVVEMIVDVLYISMRNGCRINGYSQK